MNRVDGKGHKDSDARDAQKTILEFGQETQLPALCCFEIPQPSDDKI